MFLFENKTKLQIYEIFFSFKGIFYPKKKNICHHLLTLKFLLLKTKCWWEKLMYI